MRDGPDAQAPPADDSLQLESDIHALLALGVPLSKLEELYGESGARAAAHTFVVTTESAHDGRLRVGLGLVQRSKSSQERALANPEFVASLMRSLEEEPSEMLMDALMMAPLKDPVVLSTGFVVDRSTALDERGQLRFSRCPFSRAQLKPDVYPLQLLRKLAVEWRLTQLDRCLQLADIFVEARHWESAEQVFRTAESFLDDVGDGTYLHLAERLARLERRAPGLRPQRAIQIHKRLCAVALPAERERLVREAAEDGLRAVTALLDAATTVSKEAVGGAPAEAEGGAPAVSEEAEGGRRADVRAWLGMLPWLSEAQHAAAWAALRVPWAEQALRAAKLAGVEAEVGRCRRHVWRLLPEGEARAAFLAREGLSAAELHTVGPPFDPTGWRRLGSPEGGIEAAHGRVLMSRGTPAYQFGADLSPRAGCDWAVEVAFKPSSLEHASYRNSIFSQHGHGSGWELRADRRAVEVVFTTTRGGHNEFACAPPLGVRLGEWHHCLLLYRRDEGELQLFVDGVGPATRAVRGDFVGCDKLPLLGLNPDWHDRGFSGEVAFARGEHCLPCPPSEVKAHAVELAQQRLGELDEEPRSLEVMHAPPFKGAARWTVRWVEGNIAPIVLDVRGRWQLFGAEYRLLPTSPVSFEWQDGTVQTLQAVDEHSITWRTTHPNYPTIFWDRPRDGEAPRPSEA